MEKNLPCDIVIGGALASFGTVVNIDGACAIPYFKSSNEELLKLLDEFNQNKSLNIDEDEKHNNP